MTSKDWFCKSVHQFNLLDVDCKALGLHVHSASPNRLLKKRRHIVRDSNVPLLLSSHLSMTKIMSHRIPAMFRMYMTRWSASNSPAMKLSLSCSVRIRSSCHRKTKHSLSTRSSQSRTLRPQSIGQCGPIRNPSDRMGAT